MTIRRLLVTCLPGYGHVHPLLPLTLAHRNAGWEVLVLRAGVPHIGHGVSVAISDAAFFTAIEPELEALHRSHGLDDGPRQARATTYLDICPPMLNAGTTAHYTGT